MQIRHTARLRLEPVSPAHADDLWRVFQDEHIAHWYGGAWSPEQAATNAAAMHAAWRADGVHKWVAYHRETGELVGRGGLSWTDVTGSRRLEVGWAVRSPFRGQGYATEIGRAGLDFAVERFRAGEVIAFTERHNSASRAVMERLGMRYHGELHIPDEGPFALYATELTTANGIRLAYRVAGVPRNPAMVLLHGLGDSQGDWDAVLPALTRDFRVYALDLRGHGGSEFPGTYSFELMRDDVIAFLDVQGIDSCVLLGHSMGAVVAVLVAQSAQHRLTHLILEDATVPRPGDMDRPPLDDVAEVVNPIRAQLTDPDPAWWEKTQDIQTKTLIIAGSDSPVPRHMLESVADRMPSATLTTVSAGHNVHRDNPDDFVTAVTRFLS
ncbi:GNAT family N-acetyltransferase [Actinoplanes sp. NPDC051861]|uniref:GNAT family N-acetyltransferase n=1 Tax=Actinoplanes sp. NPDC051861 TaxID=3155170 RepID=UPI0034137202